MCEYFSAILMRDGEVLTSDESNSLDDIINANNLNDVKLQNRDFIRIEITPNEPIKLLSKKRSDWVFREDEESTLPSWYDEGMMSFREKCWTAWESSIQRLIHDKMDVPKLLELIEEVKSINYMDNHGEPLPDWHMFDNRDDVRYAVRDTVMDTVRDTVRDAVWNAVRDAVLNAVRDTVWDAVLDSRLYIFVNTLPNMKPEHIDYINRRMDVWKRGYGCYCDVDGELYCYKR